MNKDNTPRWQYRFSNFKRAYTLLQEATENVDKLSQLEQEGLIQRFEYCTELAWKTIKDYLESEGVVFKQATPRAILKEAISLNFLSKGQVWLDILDARNKMSHTYDFQHFQKVAKDIAQQYINCFASLYEILMEKVLNNE